MNNLNFNTMPTMPYANNMNTYTNRYINPYNNMTTFNNGINWVQGIEGAKAWQLAPNSNVMLLDSDTEGRFYIKVSDNVGMCTLRTFAYNEITNNPTTAPTNNIDMSNYVTKDELNQILSTMQKGVNNNVKQSIQPNAKQHNTNNSTAK